MIVPCAYCERAVETTVAVEVYVPVAAHSLGAVQKLGWAHVECVPEFADA